MSASNGPWSATPSGGGYRRKPYIVIRGPAPVSRRIARVDADQPEAAALIASAPALVSALEKCIRDFENMDENQPTDAGCIDCTAGTVPNHLNTGRCGYHEAKVALRLARGEA